MPDLTALHSLLDNAAKEAGKSLWTLVCTGAGLGLKLLYDLWKRWRADRRQAKQSSLGHISRKTLLLNDACLRICLWCGAKHTSVYAFANGSYNLNNDSILKLNMVGENRLNASQQLYMNESQGLAVTSFPLLMEEMDKGRTVWLYLDREGQDYGVNAYMQTRGFTTRVVLPLLGEKKKPIGILCLSWTHGEYSADMLPSLADLETHRRHCAAILAQS